MTTDNLSYVLTPSALRVGGYDGYDGRYGNGCGLIGGGCGGGFGDGDGRGDRLVGFGGGCGGGDESRSGDNGNGQYVAQETLEGALP